MSAETERLCDRIPESELTKDLAGLGGIGLTLALRERVQHVLKTRGQRDIRAISFGVAKNNLSR